MSIDFNLARMASIKANIQLLQEEFAVLEKQCVEEYEKAHRKTVTASIDGREVKGTLVKGTRVVIREQDLLNRLDAKQKKKVTKEVLDKDKLEAAVALGDVDATVVAECSDEKDTKPYIKISGDPMPLGWQIPAPRPTRRATPKKR